MSSFSLYIFNSVSCFFIYLYFCLLSHYISLCLSSVSWYIFIFVFCLSLDFIVLCSSVSPCVFISVSCLSICLYLCHLSLYESIVLSPVSLYVFISSSVSLYMYLYCCLLSLYKSLFLSLGSFMYFYVICLSVCTNICFRTISLSFCPSVRSNQIGTVRKQTFCRSLQLMNNPFRQVLSTSF